MFSSLSLEFILTAEGNFSSILRVVSSDSHAVGRGGKHTGNGIEARSERVGGETGLGATAAGYAGDAGSYWQWGWRKRRQNWVELLGSCGWQSMRGAGVREKTQSWVSPRFLAGLGVIL